MNDVPPITDRLPLALRAYATRQFRDLPDPDAPEKPARKDSRTPASPWTLVFDTETTIDPGQALKFGTYQFRKGDAMDEAGIFYDPEGVTEGELETLQAHADAHGLTLRTRDDFADTVFFARAYQLRAAIVGFNLPFDISRLAIAHGTARSPLDGDGGMRGAFTFKLSRQKIYPNVRVKHMSRVAAQISFAAAMRQPDGRGQRRRGERAGVRRGHFIDVKTIAGALFARRFDLAGLCKFLNVENGKLPFDGFAGPITDAMIGYAVRDTQATWECHAELMARLGKLALTRTKAEKVYSEASIGKGYLREMGVKPWRDCQPDFPSAMIGNIMGSYYGGRCEVRIRREKRQVIPCDFLSMYPTVCSLMGLWRFVIADGMTWRDATDEARAMIASVDLAALQSKPAWANLTTLVRVECAADIFPVRAGYGKDGPTTIGANYLSCGKPLWFTLADCIASKLFTGKSPRIVEAVTFAPGPVQSGLRGINIAGNPEYRVDPANDDFFRRLIELRQAVKGKRDAATGAEREAFETEQNSLKIAANATSYGIYIEENVDKRSKRQRTTIHSATSAPFSFATDKPEMPGTFFHPLLGTLITGAARLMLAITEQLVSDAGLEWSFCDTDSMAIAKPESMPGDVFAAKVEGIIEWFAALNPFAFGGSILQSEKVNHGLYGSGPEPLYCWTISSKRYALFNLAPDGTPIMRKVSGHGLAHLLSPYEDADAPASFPTPDGSVLKDGVRHWHVDLWYRIVCAALSGKPNQVARDWHPALSGPALSSYAATSPDLLRWFKRYNRDRSYREQVKPFGFMLAGTARELVGAEVIGARKPGRRKIVRKVKPTAPFDWDHATALASMFDRDSGNPIDPACLKSYADALAQYHVSPEAKFLNGRHTDTGTTLRRHVQMSAVTLIGKESHDWERQAVLGMSEDSAVEYGTPLQDRDDLAETARSFIAAAGERKAAAILSVSEARLTGFLSGVESRAAETTARIIAMRLPAALALHDKASRNREAELGKLRSTVQRHGLRATARRLGVDPSNLRRRLVRTLT